MSEALIWVYAIRDPDPTLNPMVAVVVSGSHVCTIGISDTSNSWHTSVMATPENAHDPLTRHAERMEEHGYTMFIPPTTFDLTDTEFDELDPEDKVKQTLTRRLKRMVRLAR